MEFFEIIILAIIQGITEWLPISSSGHLVLAQQFFKLDPPIFFDALLHIATLVSLFIVFQTDILQVTKAFVTGKWKTEYGKLGLYIILATIPTGMIGLLFKDWLETTFSSMVLLGWGFIITGILIYFTKYAKPKRELKASDALLIGVAQGISIIPSVSRSGATIATGLFLGVKKEILTTFSFLISIPAILGATKIEYQPGVFTFQIFIGMILAAVLGYISLKILIKIVLSNKFFYFSYYCIAIGILILFLM